MNEYLKQVYALAHDHAFPFDHSLTEDEVRDVQHSAGLRAVWNLRGSQTKTDGKQHDH